MKILLPFFMVLTLSAQVKTFDSPEAAAQAVISAAAGNDIFALHQIFGNGKGILTSGDPDQDAIERAEFSRVAQAKHTIEKDPMNLHRRILTIGPDDWPFPVPMLEREGKWSFDATEGQFEVHARRIGANEIDTIDLCAGLVTAEHQYAQADHDKDGILEYAQYIMSSPGKQDGLYYEGSSGIPKQVAEAEMRPGSTKAVPYHGYYFRILTSGSHNYMVGGKHLMGGVALVAWPAQYNVTGIHTFIVNQDGVVYEKDLGASAAPVRSFAPDKTWTRVDE